LTEEWVSLCYLKEKVCLLLFLLAYYERRGCLKSLNVLMLPPHPCPHWCKKMVI